MDVTCLVCDCYVRTPYVGKDFMERHLSNSSDMRAVFKKYPEIKTLIPSSSTGVVPVRMSNVCSINYADGPKDPLAIEKSFISFIVNPFALFVDTSKSEACSYYFSVWHYLIMRAYQERNQEAMRSLRTQMMIKTPCVTMLYFDISPGRMIDHPCHIICDDVTGNEHQFAFTYGEYNTQTIYERFKLWQEYPNLKTLGVARTYEDNRD